jgi:hypothetical protein
MKTQTKNQLHRQRSRTRQPLSLEEFIEELESNGVNFFEEKKPIEIVCEAKKCRWHKRRRCTAGFDNDNLHSLNKFGTCFDYSPM